MLKSHKNKHNDDANASVVDGKLILSFPEAVTPIVWQMDLSDAKSSSFEVIEEGKNFALVTKKQGAQKKESIAPFTTKDEAIAALMATSSALKNGHGHIHPAGAAQAAQTNAQPIYHMPPQATPQKGGAGKWVIAILCFLVIGFLFMMILNMQPRIAGSGGAPSAANTTASAAGSRGSSAANSAGVAVSADDFLRSR